MHTHTAPKLRDRLRSLVRKRANLNDRIQDELSRPAPCTIRVRTLKRLRVRLKDQLGMIAQQLRSPNTGPHGDAA
jgi:hypothetical protein